MAYAINTDISEFVPLVAEDCPGGPDFLKERALRQAAASFFRQTRCWREVVPGVTLAAGENTLIISTIAAEVSAEVVALEVNDVFVAEDHYHLRKYAREVLDRNRRGWQQETTSSRPTGYFLSPQGELRFVPGLDDDADALELEVELVLVPDSTMGTFPDFAFNLHGETIAAGAAQRLMSRKGTPWYDAPQAKYLLAVFHDGINRARVEQAKQVVDALNDRRRRRFR